MPELRFTVRWPDQSECVCYSPSSRIREAFVLGQPYPLDEFVLRAREALQQASARVAGLYGFGCGQALAQIAAIERQAAQYRDRPDPQVVVQAFHP